MTDPSPPGDNLEQLFLQYLQELDRGETSGLEEFLSSRNLSERETEQLRELIGTEQIVQEMAGPSLDDENASLPTQSHSRIEAEETVIFEQRSPQETTATPPQQFTLGGYEIREELGRGGMGVVYKAHQVEMAREVALKMIRSGCLASEEDVQRFYFEARAAGKLKHPAIVQVYQVGEIEGHHYFTMEFIEGDTFSLYAERENLSPSQIAEMMVQVAEAVDFAHQHGVLHRDLKPSNVLVDAQGHPRITDFGLAKDMTSGEQLTSSGSALGTPSYMPPEQAQALRDDITCRSDVYSLGAILYAVLTGRPPFKADSLVETLTQVIHEEPVPPRDIDPAIPRDLEAICLKCLKKSPADRYETASDLADDLTHFLQGEPVTARPTSWYDRAWQWLRNVPMIAALLGRKSSRPTPAHVRFQWGSLALAVFLILGLFLLPWAIEVRRFSVVDFSTGDPEGSYHLIGQSLAESLSAQFGREIQVNTSAGAVDGHDRLLSGEADIAFLQENALDSDELKVVAPLYQEAVLVILRNGVEAESIEDLSELNIALGDSTSGTRLSSRKLLRFYGLSETHLKEIDHSYTEMDSEPDPELDEPQKDPADAGPVRLDGAFVTIKPDNDALTNLLRKGDYHLLDFSRKKRIPGMRWLLLDRDWLEQHQLPPTVFQQDRDEINVPATFAILAVRKSTPDRYVTDVLEALYAEGGVTDQHQDIFTLYQAAEETDLNYHDAASRFFSRVRRENDQTTRP